MTQPNSTTRSSNKTKKKKCGRGARTFNDACDILSAATFHHGTAFRRLRRNNLRVHKHKVWLCGLSNNATLHAVKSSTHPYRRGIDQNTVVCADSIINHFTRFYSTTGRPFEVLGASTTLRAVERRRTSCRGGIIACTWQLAGHQQILLAEFVVVVVVTPSLTSIDVVTDFELR